MRANNDLLEIKDNTNEYFNKEEIREEIHRE